MIELTYKCNFKCVHCYNPSDAGKKELLKEEIFSILDQLVDLGTVQVAFTGGEMFMRPDVMDIIFYARKKGLYVAVMTNGSLLTEEIADELISMGVGNFEISVLGASKETFDKMTQIKGSFDKVMSVVRMLRRKGVIPKLKTCVTNINVDEFEKIIALAKKLDTSFSYSAAVIPKLDLNQCPGKFRIKPDEFLNMRKRYVEFVKTIKKPGKDGKTGKQIRRQERPGFWERESLFGCMAGHTGVFINPYGEMKTCMTVPEPYFDTKKMSVAKCWEKIKEFTSAIKAPSDWQCYTCEYRVWCSWCPGRAYLNTGDIFGCPPYYRELAKARKKRYEEIRASQSCAGNSFEGFSGK